MRITFSTDNLILGAGLSGLSFAYFLRNQNQAKNTSAISRQPNNQLKNTSQNSDYLIIEKESEPGGYCRTIKNPDYVWDFAGHFYHFKHDKYKAIFKSMVESDQIVQQTKNTKIFYKNQLVDYPFQTNIHQLPKEEFIDCLYDLFTKDSDADYHDFLEMLYVKFGKSITEKFLRPYNEKLYATDLKNLDCDAMGRFFPYADLDAIVRNMKEQSTKTYNDTFLYLKKGTGYFIDKLYQKIDHSKVKLKTIVTKIDTKNHLVTLSNGTIVKYQNLINTIPFNQFLKLLDDSLGGGPATNNPTELANQLSYNQVLVFNLGFNAPSPNFTKEHWIYFPDKALNFYRIGFYNNILSQPNLSTYVEIGFSKDVKIVPELELQKVLDGMKKIGIIDDSMNLVDKNTLIMDPAYVHISTKEDQAVKNFQTNLEAQNIYNLGRYGKWTYNSMEDCMELADELASNFIS